jgi:hypothetical protein
VQVLNIFTIFIFRNKLSRSTLYSLPSFSAKPLADTLKTTTVQKLTTRHREEKAITQMAHLVLPAKQGDPFQNQKSHFSSTHQLTSTVL